MSATDAACHEPTGGHSSASLPWADDPRGDDKTRLLKYVRENGYGVPVVNAVRAVVAPDAEAGDADHRLALRFYRGHPDLFKTDRRDGFVWVEPRPAAFHLTVSKHSPKHTDSDGMALSNAKNVLGRRRAVTSDGTRGVLLGALAAKRDATEDEFVVFRDRTDPSNHLLVPFATRFNSPRRVREARERFDGVWRTAAERFDRGVVLTLTTDPARFDSLAAATETLIDDVNRLKAWVANRFADGSRPPSVVVPEFTEKGFPHVHVALFGEGFVPHAVLSNYWGGRRDRGSVVWCDAVVSRCDRWLWVGERPDRADGRGPRAYLGKTLGDLKALAAVDPETVHAAAGRLRADDAEDDDLAREWWKLACYWATETRLFTTSPSLRSEDSEASARDARGDADGPRWQFVGVARYGDLPAHVTRDATLIRRERRRRPPPGAQNRSYEPPQGDNSSAIVPTTTR